MNYNETKERRRTREEMSVADQKKMCKEFGGVWINSYRKGHIEVPGYCRNKKWNMKSIRSHTPKNKRTKFKHTESEAAQNWNYDTDTRERKDVLKNIGESGNYKGYPKEELAWKELPKKTKAKLRKLYEEVANDVNDIL